MRLDLIISRTDLRSNLGARYTTTREMVAFYWVPALYGGRRFLEPVEAVGWRRAAGGAAARVRAPVVSSHYAHGRGGEGRESSAANKSNTNTLGPPLLRASTLQKLLSTRARARLSASPQHSSATSQSHQSQLVTMPPVPSRPSSTSLPDYGNSMYWQYT